MQLTPLVAVHLSAALTALAIGPVAVWARAGGTPHARLHRAFGYAWVTLMVAAALTAVFIRDFRLPNRAGYTPIHILVPVTLLSLVVAFRKLARGDVAGHRRWMQGLYVGGCIVAGAFAFMPGRYLNNLLFGQLLALV
jgi:uncharacterized membrane protein